MEKDNTFKKATLGVIIGLTMLAGVGYFVFNPRQEEVVKSASPATPTIETSVNMKTINPTVDKQWFIDNQAKVKAFESEIDSATTVLNAANGDAKEAYAKNLKDTKEKCDSTVAEYNVNRENLTDKTGIDAIDPVVCQ